MSTFSKQPPRQVGQRAGLSHAAVLRAARRIADDEGLERLTMRRLSAEVGVMPNALYNYFVDKDALLAGLLDDLLGEIEASDVAERDWRGGLVEIMDSSRRLVLAHPQLATMFLSRQSVGPNAARLGEITFRLLRQGGLEGERAVEAFRTLLIYTLGFAAFQAPRQQSDASDRTDRGRTAFSSLDPDRYPELRDVAELLATHPTDENFLTGLRWLIDGMSAG
jgi:TetR/AcrR family transcriptional regulator, tetracycline repressor protein